MKVCGGGRCDQKGGMEEVWRFGKVVGGCDNGRCGRFQCHLTCLGFGEFLLSGKSSREFKYGCGEISEVVNMSS
nr:hypothetical protein [Tanacetum cinerariifolium]